MTGSNRLLLRFGGPLVAFVTLWALSRRSGRPVRELLLAPHRRVELAFLAVAGVLAFVMPVTHQIHLALAAGLLVLFATYLYRVSRGGVTEPELLGTPARIAALPARRRRWTIAGLFTVAAVMVLVSAEPFANALTDTGAQLGVDRFLLVQWLAPLASEAPEFIVAVLLARRGNGDDAIGTLLSSKVNQWTLLIGSLPFAYLLGGGGAALHLDARQVEEVLLTATQTTLGFALLVRLRFHLRAAATLLALFAVQFAFPGTTARLLISTAYAILAVAMLVAHRRDLRAVLGELRPSQRAIAPTGVAGRAIVTVFGVGLLITGVVMLAAPGPGLALIALALLVLGTENAWVRRRYHVIRAALYQAASRAVLRKSTLAASIATAAAMIGAGIALAVIEEMPGADLVSGLTLASAGVLVLVMIGYAARYARRARGAKS
jgi:cation:H+ antiporter